MTVECLTFDLSSELKRNSKARKGSSTKSNLRFVLVSKSCSSFPVALVLALPGRAS